MTERPADLAEVLRVRRLWPYWGLIAQSAWLDNFLLALVFVRFALTGDTPFGWPVGNVLAAAVVLFIAPYLLCSGTSAALAEGHERLARLRRLKKLDLPLVTLAAVCWFGGGGFLMLILPLFGARAALLGPLKYAALNDLAQPRERVTANSLVTLITLAGILLGQITGLVVGYSPVSYLALPLLAAAWLGSVFLRRNLTTARTTDFGFSESPLKSARRALASVAARRALLLPAIGVGWFWFFGTVFVVQLPEYVRGELGAAPALVLILLGSYAIGLVFGGVVLDRMSRGRLEPGLVPVGAIGMAVCGALLWLNRVAPELGQAASVAGFYELPGSFRLTMDLFLTGMFAAWFVLPLQILLQDETAEAERGWVMAGLGIITAAMIIAAALWAAALASAGLGSGRVFFATAMLSALVAAYIFWLMPVFPLRFVVWVVVRIIYRIREDGLENIPAKGPALLVCNHVGFVDWLILGGVLPRPPRFVMTNEFFKITPLRWLFVWGRAIPIAPAHENPELLQQAYDEVARSLERGDLVAIFPEGKITKTGEINEFKQGIERIIERTPVDVVPMALRGVWGSWFSRKNGAACSGLPTRFWSRIDVVVGTPVSPDEATAAVMQDRVRRLRGDRL